MQTTSEKLDDALHRLNQVQSMITIAVDAIDADDRDTSPLRYPFEIAGSILGEAVDLVDFAAMDTRKTDVSPETPAPADQTAAATIPLTNKTRSEALDLLYQADALIGFLEHAEPDPDDNTDTFYRRPTMCRTAAGLVNRVCAMIEAEEGMPVEMRERLDRKSATELADDAWNFIQEVQGITDLMTGAAENADESGYALSDGSLYSVAMNMSRRACELVKRRDAS